MSQISEQQLKNTIRALSKALSSKVDKPERVNKHCKKTVITLRKKRGELTNLPLVRLMQRMNSKLPFNSKTCHVSDTNA